MSVPSAAQPEPLVRGAVRSTALERAPWAFLVAFGAALGVPAANGGYFPTSWGWSGLALVCVATLALLLRAQPVVGRWEAALLVAWTSLVGWTWLSALWSKDVGSTILEGERALVLLSGVAAIVCVRRRGSLGEIAGGLLLGITAIAAYALATRLFPNGSVDLVAANRLARPVGYWNALGIFCDLGAILAVGLAAHARRAVSRALASGSLAVLVPTLYFTYSRGAWLALGFGVVVAVAVEARRLRLVTALLLAAPAPAIGVFLAERSRALTQATAVLAQGRHEGHRLAVEVLVLVAAGALVSLAAGAVERSAPPLSRALVRAYVAVLAGIVVVIVATGLVHYGSPTHIARRAWNSFNAPPPQVTGDLNQRLFNLSSNGRVDLWKAAWHEAQAHPLLGAGAGTFEPYWLAHRTSPLKVRDAHGLYIETLAELGPFGLALLVAALGLPIAAALRARRSALVAPVLGAYCAFLLHAGVDWDWEVVGVTLAAVLCGIALVGAADDLRPRTAVGPAGRGGAVAAAVALAALLFVALVGNLKLGTSAAAASEANWAKAQAAARSASSWAPWSSDPWRALGEAQLGAGDAGAAAVSFRKAIAKAPDDWSLWFDLARATTGAPQRRALARAHQLDPHSPEVGELRAEIAAEPLRVAPASRQK